MTATLPVQGRRRYSKSLPRRISSMSVKPDLFEYTSGRFLFNEELRRAERRIQFDVDALARAACHSIGRYLNGVASITKLAEGGASTVSCKSHSMTDMQFLQGCRTRRLLRNIIQWPVKLLHSHFCVLIGSQSQKSLRILQIRQTPLEPNIFYLKGLKEHL
ncbi:hypothetical protein N7491_001537 [Penicillium cf. griseofulvum]|nr:hypothetical protein N7491_001537 [Penicillium cf. griseofulvum]